MANSNVAQVRPNYFKELLECASKASTTPPHKQSIRLAGRQIELHFGHQQLEDTLFPALAHLGSASGSGGNLKILVWDSKTSGIALPQPAMSRAREHMARGERWGINLRGGDPAQPRLFYMPPPNQYLCAFQPHTQTAVYWSPDPSLIPYYERGSPLRTIFDWWLESIGLLLTHAAAVGNAAGGALIVGKGGRGKSTAAISTFRDNTLHYLADDYLVLEPGARPQVHSIYSTGKLDADHLRIRMPELVPLLDNGPALPEEKGLFFFQNHFPDRILPRLPLTVALLPDVYDGGPARAVLTSPNSLLLGLAASTIYQSTGTGAVALQILSDTIRALPCYRLEIGSELDSIAPCIESLIARHASN